MTPLALAAGGGVALAGFAAWRERRSARRSDPDAVAVVDWRMVQLAALSIVLISGYLALHG